MQNLSENIANTELYSEDTEKDREPLWFEKYDLVVIERSQYFLHRSFW